MRKILPTILLLIIIIFIFPSSVSAESTIQINEVYPNPNSGENEFVEIKFDENPVDVANYVIQDLTTSQKQIETYDPSNDTPRTPLRSIRGF